MGVATSTCATYRRTWWGDQLASAERSFLIPCRRRRGEDCAHVPPDLDRSVYTRYFLRRYMPTNIRLDAIRTRRGLKWGVPAMLLVLPYLYVASLLMMVIEDGTPGWLHVLVVLCIWNAMKFAVMGPVSIVLLLRARATEWRERRMTRRSVPAAA